MQAAEAISSKNNIHKLAIERGKTELLKYIMSLREQGRVMEDSDIVSSVAGLEPTTFCSQVWRCTD